MLDAKMEQALSNGIKDTMWSMFWKGKQKANLPELEDAVKRLIRMGQQNDFCNDLASIGRSTATDMAFDAYISRRDHLEEIMRAFFRIAFEPSGYLREKTDDMMIAETIWDTMRFARGESRWDKPLQIGPEPCPKIERTEV